MNDKNEILIKFINNEIMTVPIMLNNKLNFNNIKFTPRNEIRDILYHIDEFLNGNDLNRYFILPGLRGVGKTTLLYQIYEYLIKEKNIPQNQILYLSCDKLNERFKFKILDVVECFLHYFHNSSPMTLDKKIFLLVDESQYDHNWALSAKNIYDSSNNIFMIFTGSSALDLEYNADSARRLLKRTINPLTYREHLSLKYGFDGENMSKALYEAIFNGNVENAIRYERQLIPELYNIENYVESDWNDFMYYGGFPTSFFEKNKDIISEKLNQSITRIISKDISRLSNNSINNLENAFRVLNFLSLQQPGEISQNNIANYLECSSTTIKNILNLLEKTHLIFHCEPYGSASVRYKKSWRYFFATSSLRHVLNDDLDNPFQSQNAYEGILLENFVASNLFILKNRENLSFNLFFDSKSKNKNVDFLLQKKFSKPIPMEVGIGKKDKKQIISSINRYKSDWGIIVSNKTSFIKKENNIIYIPPRTFSFL